MITIPFRGAGMWAWRLGRPITTAPVLFTVKLDGETYSIGLESYRYSSLEILRDQVAVATEASDALFNAQGSWTRYRSSWHRGADQEDSDLGRDSDPFRFLDSSSIMNWERNELTLHHSMALSRAVSSSTPLLQRSGNYLFLADGTTLYRTSDLETWTAVTGLAGTIKAMTSDGVDLFVATTSNVYKVANSGTSASSWSTGAADQVAFVANLMLVGNAQNLYNVTSGGTRGTAIKTHFQSTVRWGVVFAVGSRIYVGGYAGDRSELYTLITDDAGAPVLSSEAAPLPSGELLRCGIGYAGAVLLGTNRGVRFAQIGGDGTLTYGPLIDGPGDCESIMAEGRFAYAGWSDISGVAQIDLSEAVRVLQPAYAAGVRAPSSVTADVGAVARLNDRTVVAIKSVGVYAEDTTLYQQRGQLDSGLVYFGTVEDKVLTELVVRCLPLRTGESVTARVFDEYDTQIAEGALTRGGESVLTLDLGGRVVSAFYVELELGAGRAGS